MAAEVQANLSFSNLKRGDRIRVDIHDPAVAALVAARYLRIVWEEPDGLGEGCGGGELGVVCGTGVDSGDPGPQEEVTDGAGAGFSDT